MNKPTSPLTNFDPFVILTTKL